MLRKQHSLPQHHLRKYTPTTHPNQNLMPNTIHPRHTRRHVQNGPNTQPLPRERHLLQNLQIPPRHIGHRRPAQRHLPLLHLLETTLRTSQLRRTNRPRQKHQTLSQRLLPTHTARPHPAQDSNQSTTPQIQPTSIHQDQQAHPTRHRPQPPKTQTEPTRTNPLHQHSPTHHPRAKAEPRHQEAQPNRPPPQHPPQQMRQHPHTPKQHPRPIKRLHQRLHPLQQHRPTPIRPNLLRRNLRQKKQQATHQRRPTLQSTTQPQNRHQHTRLNERHQRNPGPDP